MSDHDPQPRRVLDPRFNMTPGERATPILGRIGGGRPRRLIREDGWYWCSFGEHFQPAEKFYLKKSAPAWKDGTPARLSWCVGCCCQVRHERYIESKPQ